MLPGDASGGGIEQPPETKENAVRRSWEKAQEIITSGERQGGYFMGFIRGSVRYFMDIHTTLLGIPRKILCFIKWD